MSTDRPPLDDLLGKRVRHDGQEWTVRYSDITGKIMLERPLEAGFEVLLKVLREGLAELMDDPAEIAKQPVAADREAAGREWLLIDAVIAGARLTGKLSPESVELLERRLEQLAKQLSKT